MLTDNDPPRRDLKTLRADLERSIAQARRGETVPIEEVLVMLEGSVARMTAARTARLPAAE